MPFGPWSPLDPVSGGWYKKTGVKKTGVNGTSVLWAYGCSGAYGAALLSKLG